MKIWKTVSIVIAAILALAPITAADWLVMKDGSRVEALEGWQVEGKRVVFTSANGTLSMVRLSEVDMAATEAASVPPAAEPELSTAEPEPRPAREPVLVLTDADIPRGSIPEEQAPAAAVEVPSIADREPVQIIDWSQQEMEGGGVELRGEIRNTGKHMATNINVRADIKAADGELITQGSAFLSSDSLLAGGATSFRLVLPDIDSLYDTPTFVVTSEAVSLGTGRETMKEVDPLGGSGEAEEEPEDEETYR